MMSHMHEFTFMNGHAHIRTHSHKGSVSTRADSDIGKDWAPRTREQPGDKEWTSSTMCTAYIINWQARLPAAFSVVQGPHHTLPALHPSQL